MVPPIFLSKWVHRMLVRLTRCLCCFILPSSAMKNHVLKEPTHFDKTRVETGGGTQVWFWYGCAAAKFERRPIQILNFQEKVTHSYTNCNLLNFGPNFEQNHLIFPNFLKFGNILKNWPFIYQILHLIWGHSYTKRLISLPMLVAHSHRVFCTEYPPSPGWNISVMDLLVHHVAVKVKEQFLLVVIPVFNHQ